MKFKWFLVGFACVCFICNYFAFQNGANGIGWICFFVGIVTMITIIFISPKSRQSQHYEKEKGKTSNLKVVGILNLIIGGSTLFIAIALLLYGGFPAKLVIEADRSPLWWLPQLVFGTLFVLLGIWPLLGGIFAFKRQKYKLVMFGSIICVFVAFLALIIGLYYVALPVLVVAITNIVFTSKSRGEFAPKI